jgi:hypothetical protein
MNVEIGTEAAQFPEKEYINWIFVAVNKAVNIDALSLYSYKRNIILNIMNDLHVSYIPQQ